MYPKNQENLIAFPIFNQNVRLERREKINKIIVEFRKSKNRRLKKDLHVEIMNYLLNHSDQTGGYQTPFLLTAQEVATWYGITRRTVERWKQKKDFPFSGKVFDCWAIDCWLIRHKKVTEDFRIILTPRYIFKGSI